MSGSAGTGNSRETGDVGIGPILGRPSKRGAALRERLPPQRRSNPKLTLEKHCEEFEEERGILVLTATMSRQIRRLPR